MGKQNIQLIDLSNLVLWTENPRDPITSHADNQVITNTALEDKRSKWSLKKLAELMGDEFDFSEIPTVVLQDGKYVVYDGNRRVILALIKHQLVEVDESPNFAIPAFPRQMPCNVCERDVALKNILRKHGDSGSWAPLERDIFLNRFMGIDKSNFLIIDEATGLISNNPELNQRFVRDELFNNESLSKLGLKVEGEKLFSRSSQTETEQILDDLKAKIIRKQITTRVNRGDPLNVLEVANQKVINANKKNSFKDFNPSTQSIVSSNSSSRLTRVTKPIKLEIFGKNLSLKAGAVNNFYRDIKGLFELYERDQAKFSIGFMSMIRMSLRLITELASSDNGYTKFDAYLEAYFDQAKKTLDPNFKTLLHSENVNKNTIVSLLHIGAHSYSASTSREKAIAISIIIGAILQQSHGKS